MTFQVIPHQVWQRDDGATASTGGACPWVSPAEKARWKIVQKDWTVRNPYTNETGTGRQPFATKAEAENYAATHRPCRLSIGD